ncbi:hypothetical protein [Clostridium sp. FP1]|uniref:hypothetical protein n=1 Tax=Clostridium sp. FP1 TaxID=2724076 RepID=UPI0013E98DC9|nr:hypothetical protein [Clostridium sp. FP1]MBZ9634307.1 hypothetical protein [Clostridium sp. FP1]
MKNFLNQIGKSKFLFVGLFIGLTSAIGVKMVMDPSVHRVPVWLFFLPPVAAYILFKLSKKNKH